MAERIVSGENKSVWNNKQSLQSSSLDRLKTAGLKFVKAAIVVVAAVVGIGIVINLAS